MQGDEDYEDSLANEAEHEPCALVVARAHCALSVPGDVVVDDVADDASEDEAGNEPVHVRVYARAHGLTCAEYGSVRVARVEASVLETREEIGFLSEDEVERRASGVAVVDPRVRGRDPEGRSGLI
jgi:hypothetical protein